MTRAEEASLKAYPLPTLERITTDVYADARKNFQEGYEQAEKDLALTWEDIYSIIYIYFGVFREGQFNKDEVQQLCEQVLRRFNEQKEEN